MLSKAEAAYSTIRKEAIALLYGLVANDFWFAYKLCIVVNTDALSLYWLRGCRDKTPYLTRIAMQLSAYRLEIRHLAGILNITADLLSRKHQKASDFPPDEIYRSALSEKDSEIIMRRLTIPNGKRFSPEEVYELLTGNSLPAAPVLATPKKQRVAVSTFSKPVNRLPPPAHKRKIKMPVVRPN